MAMYYVVVKSVGTGDARQLGRMGQARTVSHGGPVMPSPAIIDTETATRFQFIRRGRSPIPVADSGITTADARNGLLKKLRNRPG